MSINEDQSILLFSSRQSPTLRVRNDIDHVFTSEYLSYVHQDHLCSRSARMNLGTRASVASSSALRSWRDQLASKVQDAQLTSNSITGSPSTLRNTGTPAFENATPKRHFTIGTDYGTTYTSVSYHVSLGDDDAPEARASDIKTIGNWPDDENTASGGSKQVPTEIWYSAAPMKRDSDMQQFDEPEDFNNGKYHEYVEAGQTYHPLTGAADNDAATATSGSVCDATSYTDETELLWGHSVALHRDHLGSPRDQRLLVERPKLMMLNTEHTEEDRRQLRQQVRWLIKKKIIRKYGKKTTDDMRDVRDLITDFLVKVYEHTKQQLVIYEDFDDQCTVDFVMAVPTIWSSQSSRILQASVEAAIRASSFGKLVNNSLGNLFIVPEPEGGVTWMLHKLPTAPVRLTLRLPYLANL
jgi:hypothetical protein